MGETAKILLVAEFSLSQGIPQIVAEGIVDGIPYLIEYYIEGSSLDKNTDGRVL